jgi:predicted O-linked N-acetylglucosamine transferase (SPINDLY family)
MKGRESPASDEESPYREALARSPGDIAAWVGLAEVCRRQQRFGEALEALLRALQLEPRSLKVTVGLARLLGDMGENEGAIASFERALQLAPGDAEVGRAYDAARSRRRGSPASGQLTDRISPLGQTIFARALLRIGRAREALPLYRAALARDPNVPRARLELGLALFDLGQIDHDTESAVRAAVAEDPASAVARFHLGHLMLHTGRLDDAAEAFKVARELDPSSQGYQSCVVYTQVLRCDGPAALAEAKKWSELYEPRDVAPLARAEGEGKHPAQERRLRVGYVSPDFRHHVDAYFLLPLLRHHSRERFEIACYSATRHPDHVTAVLAERADRWVSIEGLSDEKAAARIRDDGVDILVDLKLHSSDHRLGVFARRPAPVQVCWLSYPGTTGLRAMDFRLTDPHLDPPGADNGVYSEQSIALTDSFWCYERFGPSPDVAPPPSQLGKPVTFGSMNRGPKVSDAALELWARVLERVQGSKLIVHAQPGLAATRVVDTLGRHGVTRDRIEVLGTLPNDAYLSTYERIDVALDTYPYNGGTTTLDAFWMGVPVVTLVGPTAAGRAGLSIATNLGLSELVATTPEAYVDIAAGIARDSAHLATLRAGMRERMRASPLMDGPRFAASVEAAFLEMWRRTPGLRGAAD